MKKSVISFLLCVVMVLCITPTVFADVLWTPDNNFYNTHSSECTNVNRNFYANGKEGFVTVYKTPLNHTVVSNNKNGFEFKVSFTYTDKDGVKWGVVEYSPDQKPNGPTGWIQMNELQVVYDKISFQEEHEKEFTQYDGSFDPSKYSGDILVWSYPCSGNITSSIPASELVKDIAQNQKIEFDPIYTDKNGFVWGHLGYYRGRRDWVCLSDPTNDKLAPINAKTPNLIPAATETEMRKNAPITFSIMLIFISLVAVVVVITAIFIALFWRKRKKHT